MTSANITSTDQLCEMWDGACRRYGEITGLGPANPIFPKVNQTADLFSQLESEKEHFVDFRNKKRQLFHAIQNIIAPFEVLGNLVASIISPIFPPAPTVMGAILLLIQAARGVSAVFDSIMDLFDEIGDFTKRLDIYKTGSLSIGMKDIIVRVMTTILIVCGISRKLIHHGFLKSRMKRFTYNLFSEDKEISDCLSTLKNLTDKEHKMATAQTLMEGQEIRKELQETRREGLDIRGDTVEILRLMQVDHGRKHHQELLGRVKAFLAPAEASHRTYLNILKTRMHGSGAWLETEPCLLAWHAGDFSLLWLHGGPGVGKSYLASKIVDDLSQSQTDCIARKIPAPALCYFFCNVNDENLRSVNSILRTLIWQLASKELAFAKAVDSWSLTEDVQDTTALWRDLLVCYFQSSLTDRKLYIVTDGFDETRAEDQAEFLEMVGQTFFDMDPLILSGIRLALISRDSLRGLLVQHRLGELLGIEVTSEENDEDIFNYISKTLQESPVFRDPGKLKDNFKDEIANELYRKAGGLWVWVRLAVNQILRCRTESNIRQVLKDMPKGIPEVLQHELRRLSADLAGSEDLIQHLNIILMWVSCAREPLTLRQLSVALELHCGEPVLALRNDLETSYSSILKLVGNYIEDEDKLRVHRPGEITWPESHALESISEEPTSEETGHNSDEEYHSGQDFGHDEEYHSEEEDSEAGWKRGGQTIPTESKFNEQERITVAFHHASFYEFFKTSPRSGAFCVDVCAAEIEIAKTLLSITFVDEGTDSKDVWPLKEYATKFFFSHWEQADPSLASEHDKEVVSANLVKMFTSEFRIFEWAVEEYEERAFTDASWKTVMGTSKMLEYFLEMDGDAGQRRTTATVRWIMPPTKNLDGLSELPDSGLGTRASADDAPNMFDLDNDQDFGKIFASDEQPMRLLSRVAHVFAEKWLGAAAPILASNWSRASSQMLCRYRRLTGEWDPSIVPNNLPREPEFGLTVPEIYQCAESANPIKTGLWHVGLGQALLTRTHASEAIEQFLISLNLEVEPRWLVHALLAQAYARSGHYRKAMEHQERSNEARRATTSHNSRDRLQMAEASLKIALLQDSANLPYQAVRSATAAWYQSDGGYNNDDDSGLSLLCLTILVKHKAPYPLSSIIGHISRSSRLMDEGMKFYPKDTCRAFSLFEDMPRARGNLIDFIVGSFASQYDQTRQDSAVGRSLYWLGLFLYEWWETEEAVEIWRQNLLDLPLELYDDKEEEDFERFQTLTRMRLRGLYFDAPQLVSSRKDLDLVTKDETYFSHINLEIYGWYTWGPLRAQDHEGREYLRGRIKKCVDLLSDDDQSNDIDAVLYIFMKAWERLPSDRTSSSSDEVAQQFDTMAKPRHDGDTVQPESSEEPPRKVGGAVTEQDSALATSGINQKTGLASLIPPEMESDVPPGTEIADDEQSRYQEVECESCLTSQRTTSGWQVCRSCTFIFCSECFTKLQDDNWPRQICHRDHDFFFTGSPLTTEQFVPRGKVPIGDEVIWIEEWKDRLAEKWETTTYKTDSYTARLERFKDDFLDI